MGQIWSDPGPQPGQLHTAIRDNDINEVFRLLDIGTSVNEVHEACTPLYIACQKGCLSVVQSLLMQGADMNTGRMTDKDTPVHAAVRANQQSVVRELLQMEADINSANNDGDTALTLAVGTGNEVLLQELLAAGSNPASRSSRTALHIAVRDGSLEFVRLLLDHHSSVNVRDENDVTPLHTASSLGHMDIARVLLQTGSDVNTTRQGWGREGFSPLHESAYAGHEAMCRLLCECGADRNLRDFYGKSPLHLASESGHLRTASVLLKYGCDPVLQDLSGCTPLIYSVREGAVELVEDIISRRHNLDTVGHSRRTALHIAAAKGFELIVRILLEADAKFNIQDRSRWSPLDHALAGDHTWCVFFLLQHGHPLPPQNMSLTLFQSMISNSLSSLALILQLGWRPAGPQLDQVKLKLSQLRLIALGEVHKEMFMVVENELNRPSSLLRLSSNLVVNMLAQHTDYRTIMDAVLELEVPSDVTNSLCLVEMQQFMFSVE